MKKVEIYEKIHEFANHDLDDIELPNLLAIFMGVHSDAIKKGYWGIKLHDDSEINYSGYTTIKFSVYGYRLETDKEYLERKKLFKKNKEENKKRKILAKKKELDLYKKLKAKYEK